MKKNIRLALILLTPLLMFAYAGQAQAVDVFDKNVCRDKAKDSVVCKDKEITDKNGTQENPIFGSNGILTKITNILTAVVAIVAVIVIILAGLKFITSGNNPQEVSNARSSVIYAAIALIIAGLAQAIVRFIIDRI